LRMFANTTFLISEENTSYETKWPSYIAKTSYSNYSQAKES
jgi:hypothetical protein